MPEGIFKLAETVFSREPGVEACLQCLDLDNHCALRRCRQESLLHFHVFAYALADECALKSLCHTVDMDMVSFGYEQDCASSNCLCLQTLCHTKCNRTASRPCVFVDVSFFHTLSRTVSHMMNIGIVFFLCASWWQSCAQRLRQNCSSARHQWGLYVIHLHHHVPIDLQPVSSWIHHRLLNSP